MIALVNYGTLRYHDVTILKLSIDLIGMMVDANLRNPSSVLVCEKYEVTNGCTTVITPTVNPNRSVCHLSICSPLETIFCNDDERFSRYIFDHSSNV